ncbi:MAG: cysteine desulfurase NifS [Candidatus Altiarchaeota archaeon]
MKRIYLDHAATTPVNPDVLEAMKPYFSLNYGNASSLHSYGVEAKEAVENSRNMVGKALNCSPEEVVFTSGGTESNNLALQGAAMANKEKGRHIITSKIEHHAVLHPCEYLEKQGFEVTYLNVDKEGIVNPKELEKNIRRDTILISIMHANNEIGTIEPVKEIGAIARKNKILFHTDAVQSHGKIPIDVGDMKIDLLSISAHKLYGPKGVGALYVREGVRIQPLIYGGGHERNLRSGTENVTGIVGLAKATELALEEMLKEMERQAKLRDKLIKNILTLKDSWLNGHPTQRLPNNLNVSFRYIEGESILLMLDEKGIAASTGSACSSKSLTPSHVLTAIGLKPEEAHGSLRLTLGKENTEEEVDYVLEVLPEIVNKLRRMSPYAR